MASRKKKSCQLLHDPIFAPSSASKQTNKHPGKSLTHLAYHVEIDESYTQGSSLPHFILLLFPKPSRNWWKCHLIALAIKPVFTRDTVNKITQFSSLLVCVCADNRQLKVTAVDGDGHNGELSSPVYRLNFISQQSVEVQKPFAFKWVCYVRTRNAFNRILKKKRATFKCLVFVWWWKNREGKASSSVISTRDMFVVARESFYWTNDCFLFAPRLLWSK